MAYPPATSEFGPENQAFKKKSHREYCVPAADSGNAVDPDPSSFSRFPPKCLREMKFEQFIHALLIHRHDSMIGDHRALNADRKKPNR